MNADTTAQSVTGSPFSPALRAGVEKAAGFLVEARNPYQGWLDYGNSVIELALQNSPVVRCSPIGRGVHRPFKVVLNTNARCGHIYGSNAVFKTIHSQYETKPYCKAVDLIVTGPERELLAYALDKVLRMYLVPPTVGRNIDGLGTGSLQAWVRRPLGIAWARDGGYKYRKRLNNPWLHRLAAFDFITGQLDRHAANWIMDEGGRIYAIDNGYAFPRGDDRRFLKCNIGKALAEKEVAVHPDVREELRAVDEARLRDVLDDRGFRFDEDEGVLARFKEMRSLKRWTPLGGKWL